MPPTHLPPPHTHYFTFHPHPSPPPKGWSECLKIWYSPRKMTKSRTLQWGIIWQLSAAHRGQWLVNAQCYTWLTGGSWWGERLRGQEVTSRLFGQSGSQMSARRGNGDHSSHLSHDLGPEDLSTTNFSFPTRLFIDWHSQTTLPATCQRIWSHFSLIGWQ